MCSMGYSLVLCKPHQCDSASRGARQAPRPSAKNWRRQSAKPDPWAPDWAPLPLKLPHTEGTTLKPVGGRWGAGGRNELPLVGRSRAGS